MGLTVRDIMQADVRSVHPALKVADLERDFERSRVSGFPVVEAGKLVGVVSRTDVIRRHVTKRAVEEALSDFYGESQLEGALDASGESKGLMELSGSDVEGLSVARVMAPSPIITTPGTSIAELAQMLLRHRIHRVPVVEGGHLVGIVTATDLVRAVAEGRT